MILLIKLLTGIIALEHLYILYVEMFAWTSLGRKIAKEDDELFFTTTKSMAANQGLYNGFLAAGFIWSIFVKDTEWSQYIGVFFSSCVLVAGVFGGLSVSKSIFLKQGLPAGILLVILIINLI